MVNYSKWDNLDISDDEDESSKKAKPRVQKFDAAQTVTIGGKNADNAVEIRPQAAAAAAEEEADEADDEPMEIADEDIEPGRDHREDVMQCRALAERALRDGDAAEAVRLLEKAERLGGAEMPGHDGLLQSARRQAALSASAQQTPQGDDVAGQHKAGASHDPPEANGAIVGDRYRWTQTRDSVDVYIFVPDGTKAKAVVVKVLSDIKVSISVGGVEVFAGDWEFKVDPEEDPDWEVKDDSGRRAVKLTVKKAAVPGGLSVVVWWKRVLKGDPGIEVDKIEGRKTEANEKFAQAWKEAHVLFKDKAQNRKKIEIDCSGENDAAMEE